MKQDSISLPGVTRPEGLQGCPFCGRAPRYLARADANTDSREYHALACYCGGYLACAHHGADTQAEAVALWNRRAAAAAPVAQPVHDAVWEALQRMIEDGGTKGPASREDALTVARHRDRVLFLRADPDMREQIKRLIRERDEARAALAAAKAVQPELTVWFGSMPESCGRENWTVMLRRKAAPEGADPHDRHSLLSGFTVCRSEYRDRMRYEADRLRFLLGEIDKQPWILDYDADLHSGYVERAAPVAPQPAPLIGWTWVHMGDRHFTTDPSMAADLACSVEVHPVRIDAAPLGAKATGG